MKSNVKMTKRDRKAPRSHNIELLPAGKLPVLVTYLTGRLNLEEFHPGVDDSPHVRIMDGRVHIQPELGLLQTSICPGPDETLDVRCGEVVLSYFPEDMFNHRELGERYIRALFPAARLAAAFELDEAEASRLGPAGCYARAHPDVDARGDDVYLHLLEWALEAAPEGEEVVLISDPDRRLQDHLRRAVDDHSVQLFSTADQTEFWYTVKS